MSTEKDREVATEHYLKKYQKGIHPVHSFLAGIEHARQGDRAKLIKFITWVRNHYAVNAVIDNKGMVDFYLEQEKQV